VKRAAPLLLLLAGCSGTDWTVAAEKSLTWTTAAEGEAALFALLYGGRTDGGTDEAYADQAAAFVTTKLGPCVTVTTSEPVKTYTFKACGGLFGLQAIDGVVTASYSINDVTADRLDVVLSGSNVKLDGRTAPLALAGENAFPSNTWAADPARRSAFHLGDTDPPASNAEDRDALLALSGNYGRSDCGLAAEQSPPSIDAANGLVAVDDGSAWTIAARGYRRCAGGCPAAGGSIQAELAYAVRVDFDGSASALATNLGTGETASLPLGCTP
jgi:hypothetical protein